MHRARASRRTHARRTGAPTRQARTLQRKTGDEVRACVRACTSATRARLPVGSRCRSTGDRETISVTSRIEPNATRTVARVDRFINSNADSRTASSISRKPPRRGIDGSSAWRLLRHRRTPPSPTANTTRQWRSTRWTSRFSSNTGRYSEPEIWGEKRQIC